MTETLVGQMNTKSTAYINYFLEGAEEKGEDDG